MATTDFTGRLGYGDLADVLQYLARPPVEDRDAARKEVWGVGAPTTFSATPYSTPAARASAAPPKGVPQNTAADVPSMSGVDWDTNLKTIAGMMGLRDADAAAMFGGGAASGKSGGGMARTALEAPAILKRLTELDTARQGVKREPHEVFQMADKLQALIARNPMPERKDMRVSADQLGTALLHMGKNMSSAPGVVGVANAVAAAGDSVDKSNATNLDDAMLKRNDALKNALMVLQAQGADTTARNAEKTAATQFILDTLKDRSSILHNAGTIADATDKTRVQENHYLAQIAQAAQSRKDALMARDPRLQLLSQMAVFASANNLDMKKPEDAAKVFAHLKQYAQPKAEKGVSPEHADKILEARRANGTYDPSNPAHAQIVARWAAGDGNPGELDAALALLKGKGK